MSRHTTITAFACLAIETSSMGADAPAFQVFAGPSIAVEQHPATGKPRRYHLVYPIRHAQPDAVATAVQSAMKSTTPNTETPPVVMVDADKKAVVVDGTQLQIYDAKRLIARLDHDGGQTKLAGRTSESVPREKVENGGGDLVNAGFPEPTAVRDIAKAYSSWLGIPIVLDQSVSRKIRILADRPMSKEEAFSEFEKALQQIDLTAVRAGGLIQIVTRDGARAATSFLAEKSISAKSGDGDQSFDFPEFTDLARIAAQYEKISGQKVSVPGGMLGKIVIMDPSGKHSMATVRDLFIVAARQVGYAVQEESQGLKLSKMDEKGPPESK